MTRIKRNYNTLTTPATPSVWPIPRKYTTVIGIDPDVKASGVALLNTQTKGLTLLCLSLGELVRHFNRTEDKSGTIVVVEAGWLNTSNWHTNGGQNHRVAAKIGAYTGANHQIGKDIVDIARVHGFDVVECRPLRKGWKGKDGKITHDELVSITGLADKRTNQESRDAALLAWHYANLPVVY